MSVPAALGQPSGSATDDEETRERDELRRVMPLPDPEDDPDAADELADDLARTRFRAAHLGVDEVVKLDNYVLRRELGRGGMGVVFEAYDPILMIPVALKLLQRSPGAGSEVDVRRQREAQALASVRGDHVVRVFAAGYFKNQAWIAMEFVAGPTLAEWLRYQRQAGKLGWRDILPKFVDAARGLRSIHLAGLIHRDFKPQNAVLDADGSVRVLDFGLATSDRRPVEPAATLGAHLRSPGVTVTGELVGTIRYASPEQFVGTDLDHRSDQFSFCVALFEALWAHAPLGDGTSIGKQLSDSDGAIAIPRPNTGDVPGWLLSAVLRGLAYRPQDRFPDMAALLHELTRDRRRPYIAGALVFASVLIGGAVASFIVQPPDPLETCLSGQDAIDDLAGDGPTLARHVREWKAAYAAACSDTHRDGKPETLLVGRQQCLGRDRKLLAAVLAQAPASDRDRLVGELPPPANCLDEGLGRIASPHDPVTQQRVALVDDTLAAASAGRVLGHYIDADEAAREAVDLAVGAGHRPALARARFAAGQLERLLDRRDAAQSSLIAAASEAGLAGDLALEVDAWHELVRLSLLGGSATENAGAYLQFAALRLRDLDPDPNSATPAIQTLWAEHADMRGLVAQAAGDLPAAILAHSEAITRWQQLVDVYDVREPLAAALQNRGNAHTDSNDHSAALVDLTRAYDLELTRFGPDHPSLAANHRALGHVQLALADYAAAERETQRALTIDTDHRDRTGQVDDLQLLAKISLDTNRDERAAEFIATAQDVVANNRAASPEQRADVDYFAASLATERDGAATENLWARAAASFAAIPGARAACQEAGAHIQRGHLASFAGRFEDTLAAAAVAEAALRRAGALDCQAGADAQWLRGRVLLERSDPAGALPYLEDAAARTPDSEAIRADILDDLAHTLHDLGRDPQRLREIVLEAKRHYERRDKHDEAESLGRLLVSPPAKLR